MLTDLGKVIRRFRVLTDSTLLEMANQIDMGTAELSGIECGCTQLSNEQLNKIACYLAGKDYKKYPYNPNQFKELMDRILKGN